MHRFFLPPEVRQGEQVRIAGAAARQIARVLRLTPGEQIAVLDGSGTETIVALTAVSAAEAQGRVIEERPCRGEPRVRLTLAQALLKSDHFDLVLQKGTEVGIAAFQPVATRRTIVPQGAAAGKAGRWAAIIREAAEQSGRGVLPALAAALPLIEAIRTAPPPVLVLWEEERETGLRAALDRLGPLTQATLVVGPEGGLAAEEVEAARGLGALTVGLGPRILRAETAGCVAAAAVLYHLGELG